MNKQLAVGNLVSVTSTLLRIAEYWNTHMLDLDKSEDDLLTAIDIAVKSLMLYQKSIKERRL